MSLIAAAQEDIDAGKHSALPDKLFLLTLDDSIVPAQEKKDIKDQLLDGIKTNSKRLTFSQPVLSFTKRKRPLPPPFKPQPTQQRGDKNAPNSYCHPTVNGGVGCPIGVATPMLFFDTTFTAFALGFWNNPPAPRSSRTPPH